MSNRRAGQSLNLQSVRDRVEQELIDAFQSNDTCLIEALPASGKTYATFEAAASTDTSILYLALREDLYNQASDHCDRVGLSYHQLPSPFRECPSFNGDHSDQLADKLRQLYQQGINGRELHTIDGSLPCQNEDGCPYIQSLEFDPTDYEVLIGHPKQAYNESYLQDRVVVKDEFSETEYETAIDDIDALVTTFVQNVSLPFHSYQDLLAARESHANAKLGKAVNWFDRYGLYRDKKGVLTGRGSSYHVLAPALTYGVLYGHKDDLGNGWERTQLGIWADVDDLATRGLNEQTLFVRNQQTDEGYLLRPPEFGKADGFVGLDGTPTPQMWKLATGLDLDHREVLTRSEKQRYISKVLNHTIIQTNNSKKPYQNARNVTPPKDTELAFWIQLEEGQRPSVITSKKALEQEYPSWQNGEFFEYVNRTMNFARVHSTNAFGDKHLGFVTGSRHYGDEYIKRWGAYFGEGITPTSTNVQQWSRSYGTVGDTIRDHLYNQTLQDVLRFGRNQQPTTVYVNTSALPSWVPVIKKHNFPRFGKNRRHVIRILKQKGIAGATVADLADRTSLSKDGARKASECLVQQQLAEKCELEGYSNIFIWNGHN